MVAFAQGNAPMPKGCECDPMDFAALGHMTTCPCYVAVIATPEFRDHAGLPGGTFDYPQQTPKQNACRRCGGFNTIPHRERYQAETTQIPCPDCSADAPTPEERRDFNEAEQAMIRAGDRPGAKVAWHKRTGR